MNTRSIIVLRRPSVTNSGRDRGVGSEGTYAMYGIMNGGTMWGIASSWLVICIFMLLGAAGLFAYLFFSRR
jgi:hypothetical protein